MKVYTLLERLIVKKTGEKETRENFDWYRDVDKLLKESKSWMERDMYHSYYIRDNPAYEILEKELGNMEFEGIVDSYGKYEDHIVVVGNTSIDRTLESLYKESKVKVTIEFLE